MTKTVEPTYEIEDEILDRVDRENEYEESDWNKEPDESELKRYESGLEENLKNWSIITCIHCKGKFDLVVYHRFDAEGQVKCPHCHRGN